jgi:hypothetical protein
MSLSDPDDPDGPWRAGAAICLSCHYKWIAVYLLGMHINCPECDSSDTLVEEEES